MALFLYGGKEGINRLCMLDFRKPSEEVTRTNSAR
jgi:hypothetical protein